MNKYPVAHTFEIDDAIKYGMESAVILYNIKFWLATNEARDSKEHLQQHTDGNFYYWTYNSAKAYSKLFPYLSEDQIKKRLISLEQAGVLISNNFNQNTHNRTKWYSMPEYQICTMDSANLHDGEGKPALCSITDNKPDVSPSEIHPPKEENKHKTFDAFMEDKGYENINVDGYNIWQDTPGHGISLWQVEKYKKEWQKTQAKKPVNIEKRETPFETQFRQMLEALKQVNPAAMFLVKRKPEREAAKFLLEDENFGFERTMKWINILPEAKNKKECPQITSLCQLVQNFAWLRDTFNK